jgi:hypothetical protein
LASPPELWQSGTGVAVVLLPAVRHTPLLPAGSDHDAGFANAELVNVSARRLTPVAPATAGITAAAVATSKTMNDRNDFARFMHAL